MPDIGLSTGAIRAPKGPPGARGGRGFKRGGGRGNSQFVAHELGGVKERTEDVVTGESRKKTFPDLLLSQPVLRGLHTAGFVQPSPVQLLTIPPAKVGFDLIVQSKSGTGKTCVYVVAALEMLKPDLQGLQALVLAPTREIPIQGVTVAMQVGQELGQVKMAAFIGGISLSEDKVKAKTCQLGVGTPGRLKQLITESILPVDSVRLVVLDEADKLLEPAFLADTTAILNMLPKSKQHCPAPARQTSIKQATLLSILSSVPYTQCLVFSNYSTIAQATSDFLNSRGFPAIFISAGQDQSRRLAAMQTFKQFNCRILCSTDLTARGILPLPDKQRRQIDSNMSKFIFRGRHERLQLDELQNSYANGGLGLPNIAVKADSLMLKQMCRMVNLSDEKSFRLLGYWLGGFLRDTGYGDNFPELADIGPVSHTMSGAFPLHEYMRDTFIEAIGRGEVQRNNHPVLAPAQHDAVLRVGRQAAQPAGRGDAWDHS